MATSASQSDTGSFFAPLRGEGPFRIACITTGRGTCTGAALWKDVNTGAGRFFFVRFGGSPRAQHWRWHSAASRRLHSPSKRPVARDSARRLVRSNGQRVNGRRNVNLRARGRQHLRAKTRLHLWLAPLLSALHRFWRRGAAAPRPFRRLAQWKLARKRQGGAQGGQGGAEALDLGMGRLREREVRAVAIQLAFGRTATPGHAKDTHMWRAVRCGCSCGGFASAPDCGAT